MVDVKNLMINFLLVIFVALALSNILGDMASQPEYATTLADTDDYYFEAYVNKTQNLSSEIEGTFTTMQNVSSASGTEQSPDLGLSILNLGPAVDAVKLLFRLPEFIMSMFSMFASTLNAYTGISMEGVIAFGTSAVLVYFAIVFVEALLKWRLGT